MNELDNLNNWLETEIKPALNKLKNESQELNIYINNINKTIENNITEMNTMKDKMNKMFYSGIFLGVTNMALILLYIFKKQWCYMNYQELKNNLKNAVLKHIQNDLNIIENELNNVQKMLNSDEEMNIKSIAGKKGRIKGLVTRKIEFYLKLELIKQLFKEKQINSTYTLATLILNEIGVKTKISNITYYQYFKNGRENPRGRNKALNVIKENFNKEEILEIKEIYNELLEDIKNNLEIRVNIEN